jgi:hypothetical protein
MARNITRGVRDYFYSSPPPGTWIAVNRDSSKHIVARGDTSPAGMANKAAYVLDTMRARADALGGDWSRLSAVSVYTVHDIHPLLARQFAARGLLGPGLTWHPCHPPIRELEFEMDVRSVSEEQLLDA